MKIVSSGNTISTTEYLRKKIKARRKKILIFGILGILLLAGAILVLRLERLQIRTIKVSEVAGIQPHLVEAVAKDLLSEKYLWLIPKSNALLYPRSTLEKLLLRKFPRFSSVDLSLEGFQTLEIAAIERHPFALYCAGGTCYFLDESGFIFDLAPTFSEGVYFTYTTEAAGDRTLGEEFLPKEEFGALSDFVVRLGELGIEPLSLTLKDGEGELILKSSARLRWRQGANLPELFADLESFLESDTIKAEKNFWEKLLVLDLRTENKVFYTFRE